MVATNRFKAFDDAILESHPELKEVLKPNDQYPELKHILKNRSVNLPIGSFDLKVIINDGEIVERVYKTPKGNVVSLFSQSLMISFESNEPIGELPDLFFRTYFNSGYWSLGLRNSFNSGWVSKIASSKALNLFVETINQKSDMYDL